MRADAHYVEQLDSSLLNSPIRFLEVHGLDAPRPDDDERPSEAFVESIRRHGVLQPLLVRSRGGRHLVIAGRKRLAAAAAAGLSRVPCLIERVDDEQAPILAAATNTPSTDKPVVTRVAPAQAATTDLTFAAFADCLTAVASSANLLSPGSTLTQTVAVDLVRAEAARALQLLVAARVLKGDISVARREVAARSVIERAVDQTAAERRLRGLTVDTPSRKVSETVAGDEDLLAASFSALILAPAVLFETARSKVISLQANSRADGTVVLSAVHDGAELPHYWRSKLAETEGADVSMSASSVSSAALVLLRAARRVAELHGGHLTLDCSEGRTSLSLVVPASRS
jgi:ParB-like chromosome segregation protein Spo0J